MITDFVDLIRERRGKIQVAMLSFALILFISALPLTGLAPKQSLETTTNWYSLLVTSQADWELVFVISSVTLLFLNLTGIIKVKTSLSPFNGWIVGLTLVASSFSTAGILEILINSHLASALNFFGSDSIVLIISVAAATALYIYLSKSLGSSILGQGFWILVAVHQLRYWINSEILLSAQIKNGTITPKFLPVEICGDIFTIAVLVFVFRFRQKNGAALTQSVLIPWLIAPFAAAFLLVLPQFLHFDGLTHFVNYNHAFMLNRVHLLLVVIFSWFYLKEDRTSAIRIITVGGFAIAEIVQIFLFYVGFSVVPVRSLLLVLVAFAGVSIFGALEARKSVGTLRISA